MQSCRLDGDIFEDSLQLRGFTEYKGMVQDVYYDDDDDDYYSKALLLLGSVVYSFDDSLLPDWD